MLTSEGVVRGITSTVQTERPLFFRKKNTDSLNNLPLS
jgi:hypothetical protein